jgi:GAF domain-containing protein
MIVNDARSDPRTRDSSLVTGPIGVAFYAGVPLTRSDGTTIGTLAVLDTAPHETTALDVANLEDLAALVVAQLELRQEGIRVTNDALPQAPRPIMVEPGGETR